jgi:hypothetical protein
LKPKISAFFSWAVILLPVSLCLAVGAFVPLSDALLWWHLAFGRAADGFERIPNAIHISYLVGVDTPSVILPWLSQWWLFKVHALADIPGLLALRIWLVALALGISLMAAFRRGLSQAALFVGCICGILAASAGGLGPETFGAVFVAATLASVILSARDHRWLILPVVLAPIWVNVDVSFVVGFSLLLVAGVFRRSKWVLVATVSFALATLASPRGLQVWMAVVEQLHVPALMSVLVCGVLAVGLAVTASREGLKREEVVVGLTLVAMTGVLDAPVTALLCLPALFHRAPVAASPKLGMAAIFGFVFAVMVQPLWAWHQSMADSMGRPLIARQIPAEAAQIIASWGSRPRFYNSPAFAGLLIWELTPDGFYPVVFQDQRSLGPEFDVLREEVDKSTGVWRGVFQQNGVTAAFLKLPEQERLAIEIAEDPAWNVVWESPDAVLIVR